MELYDFLTRSRTGDEYHFLMYGTSFNDALSEFTKVYDHKLDEIVSITLLTHYYMLGRND